MNEGLMQRLRKLLAMTDPANGASEGEVKNAMRAARRIMDAHNMSLADVVDEGPSRQTDVVSVNATYGRITHWETLLVAYVRMIVGGVFACLRHTDARIDFAGADGRAELCREMFVSLRDYISSRCNGTRVDPGRSYALGFVHALIEEDGRRREGIVNGTAAIVRVDRALSTAAEQHYIQRKQLNLRPTALPRSAPISDDAYELGYHDGVRKAGMRLAAAKGASR